MKIPVSFLSFTSFSPFRSWDGISFSHLMISYHRTFLSTCSCISFTAIFRERFISWPAIFLSASSSMVSLTLLHPFFFHSHSHRIPLTRDFLPFSDHPEESICCRVVESLISPLPPLVFLSPRYPSFLEAALLFFLLSSPLSAFFPSYQLQFRWKKACHTSFAVLLRHPAASSPIICSFTPSRGK